MIDPVRSRQRTSPVADDFTGPGSNAARVWCSAARRTRIEVERDRARWLVAGREFEHCGNGGGIFENPFARNTD
jgi:hypothetical protein